MINWFLVLGVPLGVMTGSWMRQRRMERDGETYCHQPLWQYQLLTFLNTFGLVLFMESARIMLFNPTTLTLWILIISAAATHILTIIQWTRELRYATAGSAQ